MTQILNNIDNIIFDLGEVIVDVDTTKTIAAFTLLSAFSGNELFSFSHQAAFFSDFERGTIGEVEFRNELRKALKKNPTDEVIDAAWNAMLGDMPVTKLNILTELKKKYQLFALSNTNPIHIRLINENLSRKNVGDCLERYFHKTFYSYNLGSRKPEDLIYERTAAETGLVPNKTLMIDDRIDNLVTAEKMGMRVFHLKFPDQFYELFSSNKKPIA